MIDIASIQNLSESELLATSIDRSFDYTRNSRKCTGLSDEDFINFAIDRVMGEYTSGRDFLQNKNEQDDNSLAGTTFFSALVSERRVRLIKDLSGAFNRGLDCMMDIFGTDYLSDFPELDGYQVLSGDEHYIDHAYHTKKDSSGKNYAAGTLSVQNIRTDLISPLATVTEGNRKSHEMPIFEMPLRLCLPVN